MSEKMDAINFVQYSKVGFNNAGQFLNTARISWSVSLFSAQFWHQMTAGYCATVLCALPSVVGWVGCKTSDLGCGCSDLVIIEFTHVKTTNGSDVHMCYLL